MARLMKDCKGRYQIEVMRARKYVHCVIKDGCLVRTKKWPLTKFIRNDQADIGEQTYDKWWRPVPETEYPLAKAIDQFLSNPTGWMITEKALATLLALKEQRPVSEDMMADDEVPLSATAGNKSSRGEGDMSKTKQVKKQKKATLSAAFKAALSKGLGKERALAAVREQFPGRKVPDNYYAWYKNHFAKA